MTRQRGCQEAGGRGDANTRLFAFHSPADRLLGALPSPALNNRARSFFKTNGFTAFPRRAESRLRVVKPAQVMQMDLLW